MKKCVVSLGINDDFQGRGANNVVYKQILFEKGIKRLKEDVEKKGYAFIGWDKEWPKGWPKMRECPYCFKFYCINEAWNRGYRYVMWVDSSVVLGKDSLEKCFSVIEKEGYYFYHTYRKGTFRCTDYSANILGFSSKEKGKVEKFIWATFFGLDRESKEARIFLNKLLELSKDGSVFRGTDEKPFNLGKSYINHRHDQAVMNLLIEKSNMKTHHSPFGIRADLGFVKIK